MWCSVEAATNGRTPSTRLLRPGWCGRRAAAAAVLTPPHRDAASTTHVSQNSSVTRRRQSTDRRAPPTSLRRPSTNAVHPTSTFSRHRSSTTTTPTLTRRRSTVSTTAARVVPADRLCFASPRSSRHCSRRQRPFRAVREQRPSPRTWFRPPTRKKTASRHRASTWTTLPRNHFQRRRRRPTSASFRPLPRPYWSDFSPTCCLSCLVAPWWTRPPSLLQWHTLQTIYRKPSPFTDVPSAQKLREAFGVAINVGWGERGRNSMWTWGVVLFSLHQVDCFPKAAVKFIQTACDLDLNILNTNMYSTEMMTKAKCVLFLIL